MLTREIGAKLEVTICDLKIFLAVQPLGGISASKSFARTTKAQTSFEPLRRPSHERLEGYAQANSTARKPREIPSCDLKIVFRLRCRGWHLASVFNRWPVLDLKVRRHEKSTRKGALQETYARRDWLLVG